MDPAQQDPDRQTDRTTGEQAAGPSLATRLAMLCILAVALGYTEAAVVVYLRALIAPLRAKHFPDAAAESLPLLSVEQLQAGGEQFTQALLIEVTREPVPLVLLLAVAWGFRRGRGQVVGFFLIGFGLWDIGYYAFLKLLLGWPDSLGTWDVLYLIPTAWVAPVWAPLAISVTMLAAGLAVVHRGGFRRGKGALLAWPAVAAGVALVLTTFVLRTEEAFDAVPARYDWGVFWAGWAVGAAGLAWLLWPDIRR